MTPHSLSSRSPRTRRYSGICTAVILIFAVLVVFAACENPGAPTLVVVEKADPVPLPDPDPEPEPEPDPEPVWTPEAGHVYIMDASEAIVTDYDAEAMGWSYSTLLSAVKTQIEIWNRDNPDQRHVVGGGP